MNVTSHIFSYLDFKSLVAARMVSKTWYTFIENQRGIWINLMRKCFEDIPKKAHRILVRRADGTKIQILIAMMPEPGSQRGPLTLFRRSLNPIPTRLDRLSPPITMYWHPQCLSPSGITEYVLHSIRIYVLITLLCNQNEKYVRSRRFTYDYRVNH